jgi:hypothetical protein
LFFASGCIHEKESLTINKNGSGTLEVAIFLPKATKDMIDKMLGGMMQGMAQMAGAMGADTSEMDFMSASEQMFGSKEEIFKKARAAGLDIEFISFDKEVKEDGMHVNYKIKYDDINKLLATDITATQFELAKDDQGNLICFLKSDKAKVRESKQQLDQFSSSQKSEQPMAPGTSAEPGPMAMDKKMRQALTEAMRNFKMEFLITMPNPIIEIHGMFSKVDKQTAYFEVSGDLITSPELIDKLYGATAEIPSVICSGEGINFDIEVVTIDKMESTMDATGMVKPFTLPSSSDITEVQPIHEPTEQKLYLKNGQVLKGEIVWQDDTQVKIKVSSGITFTFPKEEIENIE